MKFKDKMINDLVSVLQAPGNDQRLQDKRYTIFLDSFLNSLHTLAYADGNNDDLNLLTGKNTIGNIRPFNGLKSKKNFRNTSGESKSIGGCETGDCGGDTKVNKKNQIGYSGKKMKSDPVSIKDPVIANELDNINQKEIDIEGEAPRLAPDVMNPLEKVKDMNSILDCESLEDVKVFYGFGVDTDKNVKERMLQHIRQLNPEMAESFKRKQIKSLAKAILAGIDAV